MLLNIFKTLVFLTYLNITYFSMHSLIARRKTQSLNVVKREVERIFKEIENICLKLDGSLNNLLKLHSTEHLANNFLLLLLIWQKVIRLRYERI